LDIVNALTALKSGLDDQIGVIGLATDAINGENTDEVLKQEEEAANEDKDATDLHNMYK
jgi:hypothetical protein